MGQVKTQMDLVADAWVKFQKAVQEARGLLTPEGFMVSSWDVECAMSDLQDEMIQAGIITPEMLEDLE